MTAEVDCLRFDAARSKRKFKNNATLARSTALYFESFVGASAHSTGVPSISIEHHINDIDEWK